MKQLKFDHQNAQEIIAGKKTVTYRFNDDKAIEVGDRVELVDKTDTDEPNLWTVPGYIEIKTVSTEQLKDIKLKDLGGDSVFSDNDALLQMFQRYYGEHIKPSTLLKIYELEYHPYTNDKKYLESVDGSDLNVKSAVLYADGGSRGNPGPSALGFVIVEKGNEENVLHSGNKYLGVTTNNQAEYHAAIAGMEWALDKGIQKLDVYLDSMLVVNQLKGIFKVKNRDLWTLYETAQGLSEKFTTIQFTHVPRELNKKSDREVNKALDAIKGSSVVE